MFLMCLSSHFDFTAKISFFLCPLFDASSVSKNLNVLFIANIWIFSLILPMREYKWNKMLYYVLKTETIEEKSI